MMVALAQKKYRAVNGYSNQREDNATSLNSSDTLDFDPQRSPSRDVFKGGSSLNGNCGHALANRSDVLAINKVKRICCIGAGYVGGTTCAVIASKCPDIEVIVVDINEQRLQAWRSTNLPIYEPNLYEHVVVPRDGLSGRPSNLFFSSNIDSAIESADLIFLAVNTPTKEVGIGAGLALDIGYIESAVRRIASNSHTDKVVVEKSTTPCRTAEFVREILAANGRPGVRFHVLSNPEFLAEGTAIADLLNPDRILIGSIRGDEREHQAAEALAGVYATWVPRERILTTNLWSAELAKMAANAFLAQRISSINSISAICEASGADVNEVSHAVGLDRRIGPHMLRSSVGFGGSCFRKDVLGLAYLAESLHLPEVAAYWNQVVMINEWQKDRFSRRVAACLYNTMVDKKIAVFGFAYKKNTADTRGSPAISVINQMIAERAQIAVYDPMVKRQAVFDELYTTNDVKENVDRHVTVQQDPYAAATGAHAIVVLTEWDEFKVSPTVELETATQTKRRSVDWRRLFGIMKKPSYVFDGRNVLDSVVLGNMGFKVECIGRRTGTY